jgi:hypothetical protein
MNSPVAIAFPAAAPQTPPRRRRERNANEEATLLMAPRRRRMMMNNIFLREPRLNFAEERPAANFNNADRGDFNVINVPANSDNAIMNTIQNGNTLYRVANAANTAEPGHYMRIRAANGSATNGRRHLLATRKNPLTRGRINLNDRTRMKKARVPRAAAVGGRRSRSRSRKDRKTRRRSARK